MLQLLISFFLSFLYVLFDLTPSGGSVKWFCLFTNNTLFVFLCLLPPVFGLA